MVEIVIFNKIPRNSMRFLYYAKREVFFVRFPVRQRKPAYLTLPCICSYIHADAICATLHFLLFQGDSIARSRSSIVPPLFLFRSLSRMVCGYTYPN